MKQITLSLVVLLISALLCAQTIYYVDKNGDDTDDGLSKAIAF